MNMMSMNMNLNLSKNKIPFEFNPIEFVSDFAFYNELIHYLNYIKLNNQDIEKRINTFVSLEKIIKNKWPKFNVVLYGSFSVGLSLKDSDIDVTIMCSELFNNINNNNNTKDKLINENIINLDINNNNNNINNIININENLRIFESQLLLDIFHELKNFEFCNKKDIEIIYSNISIIKCKCKITDILVDIWYFKI
jgi:DNA polymerase sigma